MAFNVGRRRDISLSLRLLIAYDLLSGQELTILSEELRERVSDAVRQPFEIEWATTPSVSNISENLNADLQLHRSGQQLFQPCEQR